MVLGTGDPLRADIFTPSIQDQIKLGDQAAVQVMRQYRVVNDERIRRVEAVDRRLLVALPSKEQIREGVAALAQVCYEQTGIPVRSANVERAGAGQSV